ncbi:hypothetical protein GIB67_004541 [Kingdonia uniflora]|uniref:ADP,ATP carrier protein n=1 Tax=Kingdonia uniflora TaxID=39325 RepID=A0A7J7ML38_9MAGN|nr:hypothetical protein GIB67_004541 [Kingdonia uniflora]
MTSIGFISPGSIDDSDKTLFFSVPDCRQPKTIEDLKSPEILPLGNRNCIINLVEVTWKSKLKAQFPSPNEYSAFMGDLSTATGIATFRIMLLSQWMFNKYGWGVAAKITPTVLLITGVAFFSLILCDGLLAPVIGSLGMTPLLAAVYVGAMQNIFSKSAKYSLFDPCKEMAYIPLDEEQERQVAVYFQQERQLMLCATHWGSLEAL